MNAKSNIRIAPDPVDETSQIHPYYELQYEKLQFHAGRGHCVVKLFLRNTGTISASYPFLSLTALGLNIVPADGWNQEYYTSIRRMKRFTPVEAVNLEPGTSAHCCSMRLRYKQNFGGCLEFEPGSERLLANCPNLTMTLIVGAGNYPSKRIIMQVPASALRDVIGRKSDLDGSLDVSAMVECQPNLELTAQE